MNSNIYFAFSAYFIVIGLVVGLATQHWLGYVIPSINAIPTIILAIAFKRRGA